MSNNNEQEPSPAWKSVVIGKHRENHTYVQFRTMCLMFMSVPIDYVPTQELERQIFSDFIHVRDIYKRKGESIERE